MDHTLLDRERHLPKAIVRPPLSTTIFARATSGERASTGSAIRGGAVRLYALLDDTNNDGEFHLNPNAPNPQCGRFVQLVDLTSCQTSNVVQLLTGTCEVSGHMALIPGGRFQMGSPLGEVGRDNDETQHWVTLTHSYCISKTELTQAQLQELLGFAGGDDYPLRNYTWHDAVRLAANAASLQQGLTPCYNCSWELINGGWFYHYDWVCDGVGNPYECEGYRLPTEAEWERAARGGVVGASFPNGGNLFPGDELDCNGNLLLTDGSLLDDVNWYCGNNNPDQVKEVGQLTPNAYGLYDMTGNVVEWCHDWYGSYPGDVVDPYGLLGGSSRAIRMGEHRNPPSGTRVANRFSAGGLHSDGGLGFRLARTNP